MFLGLDTRDDPDRLRALAGIAVFMIAGVLFSERPGKLHAARLSVHLPASLSLSVYLFVCLYVCLSVGFVFVSVV